MAMTRTVLAGVVQFYYVRLGIFFGCLGIFSRLIRGEMIERSLHYLPAVAGAPRSDAAGEVFCGRDQRVWLFGIAIIADFALMYAGYGAAGQDFMCMARGWDRLRGISRRSWCWAAWATDRSSCC